MAHVVRLTDREVNTVVRNVTEGIYREYVWLMFKIAIRERGSAISISQLQEDLRNIPYIDGSVVTRIVKDLEKIYEEQQTRAA